MALRVLPHCSPSERSKYAAWDCAQCRNPEHPMYLDDGTKRSLHCGWMDESDWVGDGGPQGITAFGDEPYKERVCPGYLMVQPLIAEIVIAHRSYEKGNWESMYPNAANVLCEGVEFFSSVIDSFRAHLMREATEKTRS